MILGLGNDFGERVTCRVFTDRERARADARPGLTSARAASYAKRFAAKEACSKALGTGFRRGVFWRDMGVVNLPSGRPTLVLTGGALAVLRDLTPPNTSVRIDLTLTDDFPYAQAIVIISGLPDKNDGR